MLPNRPLCTGAIPEHNEAQRLRLLRIQAVSLIGKHRRSHICTALRINDQALKQWERKIADPDTAQRIERQSIESAGNNEAFVELAVHKVPVSDVVTRSRPMTAIYVDLPNGTVIRTDQLFTLEQIVLAARISLEPGA